MFLPRRPEKASRGEKAWGAFRKADFSCIPPVNWVQYGENTAHAEAAQARRDLL